MYGYYALKSLGYSPSKHFAMLITSMQLGQMIIGCFVNVWAAQYLQDGVLDCHVSTTNVKVSIAMYFSYFVLFARFFYKSYLNPDPNWKKRQPESIPGNYTSNKSSTTTNNSKQKVQ